MSSVEADIIWAVGGALRLCWLPYRLTGTFEAETPRRFKPNILV